MFGSQFIATGRDVLRMGGVQEFLVARCGEVVRCAAIIVVLELICLELILLELLLPGQFLFSLILQFVAGEILFVQFGMVLAIVFVNSLRMVLAIVETRVLCRFRLIQIGGGCWRCIQTILLLLRSSDRHGSRCGRGRDCRLRRIGEIFGRRAQIVVDLLGHVVVERFEGGRRIVLLWHEGREFLRWRRIV